MTMIWLMTVQEVGTPTLVLANRSSGIEFDLDPRWISFDPGIGHEPSPNSNRLRTLRRWPRVVEIRRPDGTQVSAELYSQSIHLNFAYEYRAKRNAEGRIPSPWGHQAVLTGVSVEDMPLGSEVWGEVADEDL